MFGDNFSIYVVRVRRKSLNLCFFTHAPVPHSKLLVEFFVPRQKGWEEAMICCIKFQSENMTWNISSFSFGMISIFVTVVALQFWK